MQPQTQSNLVPLPNQTVSGSLKIQSMDDLSRLSKMMATSGFFKDCNDAAKAGVKILAGMEMGLGAFASLTGIHLINGKPAIGANLMAAKIKASGKYRYRVTEHTEKVCRIEFFERVDGAWESLGVSEALMSQIAEANIDKDWDKETKTWKQKATWRNFPKNMLFARAISNGVKWHCSDIFLGAPVYTPEELGANVDDEGNVIDVTPSLTSEAVSLTPALTAKEDRSYRTVQDDEPSLSLPQLEELISSSQLKKFWATVRGSGYTDEGTRQLLADYGCFDASGQPSSKAIPVRVFDKLMVAAANTEYAALCNQKAALPPLESTIDVSASTADDFPALA